MKLFGIIRYSLTAAIFALIVVCIWIVFRLFILRGKKINWQREIRQTLICFYLAALMEITALRIGLVSPKWLGGSICPVPLQTTLVELASGLWPFIYHVLGNMIWFIPIGFFFPKTEPRKNRLYALLIGAVLSFIIECIQYLLGTGISDIDDILLNMLGALSGYEIKCLFRKDRKSYN